jgi:hypothetical protein
MKPVLFFAIPDPSGEPPILRLPSPRVPGSGQYQQGGAGRNEDGAGIGKAAGHRQVERNGAQAGGNPECGRNSPSAEHGLFEP